MKKILNINGKLKETKMFKTRSAADNFKNKKQRREMLYFRSGEYYISI